MVANDMRSGARVAIRDIHAFVSAPITVAGSLNMDFVVQVQKLPQPGETVLGGGFVTIPGGKGANQACAAGRLGGRVRMLGRVGDDVFGRQLLESLGSAGVDTKAVRVSAATPSGVALIFVEAGGQNEIVVASGAERAAVAGDVAQDLGDASGFLLLQLETPLPTIERAAALASERGVTVILDPAPARPLPETLLARVSVLTPNESEALVLLDRRGASVSLAEAPELAKALLKSRAARRDPEARRAGGLLPGRIRRPALPRFRGERRRRDRRRRHLWRRARRGAGRRPHDGRGRTIRQRRGGALRHAPRCAGLDARAARGRGAAGEPIPL